MIADWHPLVVRKQRVVGPEHRADVRGVMDRRVEVGVVADVARQHHLYFVPRDEALRVFAILGIFAELCKRDLPLLPYENEVSDRESRVDLALISKASARQILERKIGMAIRRLDP